jgi:hypothetical protein
VTRASPTQVPSRLGTGSAAKAPRAPPARHMTVERNSVDTMRRHFIMTSIIKE